MLLMTAFNSREIEEDYGGLDGDDSSGKSDKERMGFITTESGIVIGSLYRSPGTGGCKKII